MRKVFLLSLILVLVFSGMALASGTGVDVDVSNSNQVGTIGSFSPLSKTFSPEASAEVTNINKPVNVFNPTVINKQFGINAQNNDQKLTNELIVNAPKIPDTIAAGSAPGMVDSELNFISPNERDVQTILPKFGCGVIKPIKEGDCIVEVLWQSNDNKFKDLYAEVLKGLKSKEVKKYSTGAVRYQIREAASSKTWTTGGEVAANAVGMIGSAASGVTGGLVPKVGRSKSSNLYTVFFILVQEFK